MLSTYFIHASSVVKGMIAFWFGSSSSHWHRPCLSCVRLIRSNNKWFHSRSAHSLILSSIYRRINRNQLLICTREVQMDDHRLQFIRCIQCGLSNCWQYTWCLCVESNAWHTRIDIGHGGLLQCNDGVYCCRPSELLVAIVCWWVNQKWMFHNFGMKLILFFCLRSINRCNAKRYRSADVSGVFGIIGALVWNW